MATSRSVEVLRKEPNYQFKLPFPDREQHFNPFERPQAVDYFFPSEMFLDEELKTLQLPTPGYSKFVQGDGRIAWKPCEVLSYDPSVKLFRISWPGGEKEVTRSNLRFAFESEAQFSAMVSTLESTRRNHEAYVRYLGRFELSLVEKKGTGLPPALEAGIFRFIATSMTLRQRKEIESEMRELHRRGVQKFVFDAQYFPEKWKLAGKPWREELEKQLIWREKYKAETALPGDHVPFFTARSIVQSRLLDPRCPLHLEMQRIYMRITQLRFNDYYEYLLTLRDSGALSLSQLIFHFRESFTSQIAAIDFSIKEIRKSLFDILQIDKSQDADLLFEHYFAVSQTVLESNIQFAVSSSIASLKRLFAEYFGELPLPDNRVLLLSALPKELKSRRFGSSREPVPTMPQTACISLVRDLIKVLSDSLQARALSHSVAPRTKPLVYLKILSKSTDARLKAGKRPNYFKLTEKTEERTQRRSKFYDQQSAASTVLPKMAEATMLRSLMIQSNECSVPMDDEDPQEHPNDKLKRLLPEEVFGWVNTGGDNMTLIMTPDLVKTDVNLRTLTKAPMKQLQSVTLFKRNMTIKQHLKSAATQAEFSSALSDVRAVLQFSLCGPVALLGVLRQFDYLFSPSFSALFAKVVAAHVNDYQGLLGEIETILAHKELIEHGVPRAMQFGLFEVDLAVFRTEAVHNAKVLAEQLLLEVSQEYGGLLCELHSAFSSLMKVLGMTPATVEELAFLQNYLQQQQADLRFDEIWKELGKAQFLAESLDKFHISIEEKDSVLWWKTRTWPLLMQREKSRLQKRLQKLIPKFQEEVRAQVKAIAEALVALRGEVGTFLGFNDLQQADAYSSKAADISANIEKLQKEVALANSREEILGFTQTDFSELATLNKSFVLFHSLWNLASEWSTSYGIWMDKPLRLVDCSQVIGKFKKGKALLEGLERDMQNSDSAKVVIAELKEQVTSFEPTLPVLLALKEESLRDRHWQQIWGLLLRPTGDRQDSKDTQTLRDMLQRGLLRHHQQLELIALKARSEYEVEQIWTRIDRAVRTPAITVMQHSPGLMLIDRLEDMRDTLHEYAANVSFLLRSNRHIGYFREDIKNLAQIITTQQIALEDINEFQELLMELHPAFLVPEIQHQLPRTSVQLQDLTNFFAQQIVDMQQVTDMQTHSLGISSEAPYKSFAEALITLRSLKEELEKKMAEKQSAYSRLYFLTDGELLSLMSAVQPNAQVDISSLFPGLESVQVDSTSVKSAVREGDPFPLQRKILLKEGAAWRPLEEWLSEFEQIARNTHAARIQQQFYHFSDSEMWRTRADREAMYIAYKIWFTTQVNTAFAAEDPKAALKSLIAIMQNGFLASTKSLRMKAGTATSRVPSPTGKDHPVRDRTCELLICALQNDTDLLHRLLSAEDSDAPLQWKLHFKFTATNTNSEVRECLSIVVDCLDYSTNYGFEMHAPQTLGFAVITPITEKCLVHCYLSLKHEKSVLLAGAVGAGKNVTLQHLAILCGRLLHSAYPSATQPFEATIKSLIGCALGGYWGCFEEVHSIADTYLSSLAYYVRLIQSAFEPSPVRVTIEGVTMRPKAGFAVFATSTGACPSAFHELFRCVHMLAPDLRQICSVLLQVHGFESRYSELVCRAMEMLEQQPLVSMELRTIRLSTRAGVRTLVRVLNAMVSISQRFPTTDMPYLINNAIRKVYGLGLLPRELLILDEFLATVFSSRHNDLLSLTAIIGDAVAEVLIDPKLVCQETMQRRCQHLLALLAGPSRPWVFVVGATLTGKSLIIAEVAKVLGFIEKKEFSMHRIGVGASIAQIADLFDLMSSGSNFSVKVSEMRFHSRTVTPNAPRYSAHDWIVLDSPSLSCSVLPALRKSKPFSPAHLFVETDSLAAVSPDLVSEAGILFLEDQDMDTFSFYKVVIEQAVPDELSAHIPSLEEMFAAILKPALDLVERTERTVRLGTKTQILLFSKLLKPHLDLLQKHLQRQSGTSAVPLKSAPLILLKKSKTLITKEKPEHRFSTKEMDVSTNLMNYLGCVRKQFKQLEPQLCLEAIYIMCVATTLGNLVKDVEPLSHLLVSVLETKNQEYAYFLLNSVRTLGVTSLLDLRFSLREMKWVQGYTGMDDINIAGPTVLDMAGGTEEGRALNTILIPTKSVERLQYWANFCLKNKVDVAIIGPHQSGKSATVMTVGKELLKKSYAGLIALNVSEYSTFVSIQASLHSSLEHYKKWAYGGLGGTHFYAILDDLNMDTSNEIYDMCRFWKDTGGWYSDGFTNITDLTVAVVHSFVDGKSRPLWERAVRHFFVLHKDAYSRQEIEGIFCKFIAAAGGEDLETVSERALQTFSALYFDLQGKHTELVWCHSSLSNFCMALQFLAQFEQFEARSEQTFLCLWNFMHDRFFTAQFDPTSLRESVASHLQAVLQDFPTDTGMLLPSDDQELQVLTEDSLAALVQQFQNSHKACAALYPQYLKNLHSLIFQTEKRLADFYYFFVNTLFDIQSPCGSVIIRADSQLFLAKSLLFIAANAAQVRLFDLNIADREDFASSIQDSFHGVSPLHIPTELKFTLKHALEASTVEDKKVALVYTFFDSKQLDLPIGRRLMEVANDILTGVKLRLSGFADVYKDLIEKYQYEHPETSKGMFNDEILQVLLDRMVRNVTVFFLVASKEESWVRSPLHPVGVLEKFKHKFRQIFNRSRIVDFDHMNPPAALAEYLKSHVSLQQLQYHNDLLLEIGEAVQSATGLNMKDEFLYERMIFCSKSYVSAAQSARAARVAMLQKACGQIHQLEAALETAPTLMQSLSDRAETAEQELTALRDAQKAVDAEYQEKMKATEESVMLECAEKQRAELVASLDRPRTQWEEVVAAFQYSLEEAREAEKSPPSSLFAVFYRLLTPEPLSETEDQLHKKMVTQMVKRQKDVVAKLKRVDEAGILTWMEEVGGIDLELPAKNRAEEKVKSVLERAVNLAIAVRKCNEGTMQVNAECDAVPRRAQELKLALLSERDTRLSAVHSSTSSIESSLSEIRQAQEQLSLSKPLTQRLVSDMRGLRDEWMDEIADTDSQEKDFGNSLIASVLTLKSLGLDQSVRLEMQRTVQKVLSNREVRHSAGSLGELLRGNYAGFVAECGVMGVPEARLMHDNVAALRTVHELGLPVPVIFDPYDIAKDYIVKLEETNGLVIGRVSNDLSFEQSMRKSVVQGHPVLCIDPSASLMKVLLPILRWKSQLFVSRLRGLEPKPLQFLSGKGIIAAHPNFRLYICCKVPPSAEVLDITTWINFDATDQESWEAFTSLPLLKQLDEQQYEGHLSQRSKTHYQSVAAEQAEHELIGMLTTQDLSQILTSESLLGSFARVWKKMKNIPQEEEAVLRRRPSVMLPKPDHKLPRDKLSGVVAELFNIKQTLATCAPLMKDYALPSKVLHAMIDCACAEYIRYIGVPLESQWDAFAECLAYRVFIRVCHALPNEQRQVFISFFAMAKYLQNSAEKQDFFRVMNDIFQAMPLNFDQRETFLQVNYPQVFSPAFRPGTTAYYNFLHKPLYAEVRPPHDLSKLLKYLLYAYLRPDLLPAFVRHLVAEVLGHRYTWVPKTDYSIYTLDIVRMPTIIFYQRSSPLFFLKHMAESRRITLVRTQPVFATNLRAGRSGKSIGKYVDMIINALSDNLVSSRWITIENLHTVSGLEAEVLTKYLLYFIPEHVSDSKKIWVVLQGSPEQHPQWANLIKHCQRIVMLEPETLHEHMLLWHYSDNTSFFLQYRESISQRYWAHCSLDGKAPKLPFQDTEKPVRREITDEQLSLRFKFNVSVLMSIAYLRNEYQSDYAQIWAKSDAKKLAEEFLTFNAGLDLQRPALMELFQTVMGPQLDQYAQAAFKDLTETVFAGRNSLDVGSVVYPLFRLESPVEDANMVALIDLFPEEDHILITGLNPSIARSRKISEALIFLDMLKLLHKSLAGQLDVDHELFKATERSLVSEHLQNLLKELKKLPKADHSTPALTQSKYQNVYLSREGGKNASWLLFSKEGFKVEDKQHSILSSPPDLAEILKALQHVEQQASSAFLTVVHRQARELYKYLTYRRASVSAETLRVLTQLARDQVPAEWRELSPFVARNVESAERWRDAVRRKYAKEENWDVVDLSALFQPGLLLLTIMRLAALSAKQRVEKFGFEVDIGRRHVDSSELQVKGIYLQNAEMNLASGSLEECEDGTVLPKLILRPAKLPKALRSSCVSGPKLVVRPNASELREPEYVFCPLSISPQFWVYFPSRLGQGFWSRKGVRLSLDG